MAPRGLEERAAFVDAMTLAGTAISIATAYIVLRFGNLVDYLQLLFTFFSAPVFATLLLGMFWKRANGSGAFWGLLSGFMMAFFHYTLYLADMVAYSSDMAANLHGAIYAFTACFFMTVLVSWSGAPYPERNLVKLVRSLSPPPESASLAWYRRPLTWGTLVLVFVAWLNWEFR